MEYLNKKVEQRKSRTYITQEANNLLASGL